MPFRKYSIVRILTFLTLTMIIFFLSKDIGMFWDNVLFASKMGNHLYLNGLFNINIPVEFDPGHPPFLAFINALGWKIFGHTLTVSHLMMTPFIFGFFWQLYHLIKFFIDRPLYQVGAFIIILADPTISSQLVLVNPQIIQLFFFLLAVNGIIRNQSAGKIIGLAFLGIVTYRGMMMCAGIFCFELCKYLIADKKSIRGFFTNKRIVEYGFGGLPAITYVVWRLITKGWLQTHPDSPWTELWHFVGITDFFRNIAVLLHRYLDFGRITIFLFLAIILITRKRLLGDRNIQILLILAVSVDLITAIISLFSMNAMGHRYYIASYLTFILLAYIIIIQLPRFRIEIYLLLLTMLVGGNFWIYPDKIDQGWDSSLAFYPYFKLRHEVIQYMDENKIPIEKTASFFPNNVKLDEVDLQGDTRAFEIFDGTNKYVMYSNIYNLKDNEFEILQNNYLPIKEFKHNRIRIELLQSKVSD